MIAPAGADAGPSAPARPPESGPVEGEPDRRHLGWVGLGVTAGSFFVGLVAATLLSGIYLLATGPELGRLAAESSRGAAEELVPGLEIGDGPGDLGRSLLAVVGTWVGFLLLPVLWARRHGGARSLLGLAFRWSDVPVGVAVGLASVIVTGVVSTVLLTSGQQEELESKAVNVIDSARGPLPVALLVISLCIVTPLAEEVFFRGMFFGSLQRVVRPVLAIAVAGLVFGLVHYDGKPAPAEVILVQIGLLGLFGAALCVLARATGRLGASIVAHAIFNSMTTVTLLLQR